MAHLSTDDPELHRQFVHDKVKAIRADLLNMQRSLGIDDVQQAHWRVTSAQAHLLDIQFTLGVLARLADEKGEATD